MSSSHWISVWEGDMSRLASPDTGLRIEAEMPRGGGTGIDSPISPGLSFCDDFWRAGTHAGRGRKMMHPKMRGVFAMPLAMLGLCVLAGQNEPTEPLVVVTASRFSEADPRVPANITVISREDIRNSPAKDLPGLLRGRAGIEVRALYGSLGVDAVIDLRGFGEAAVGNTLILLDGQRLNGVDGSAVSWSAIPLDAVQRIEIMRGSGSVLYGDRASGGVINIITDKSARQRASVAVNAGSNDTYGVDARLAGGNADFYFNLNAHLADTEGWRKNARAEQKSGSGRVGWRFARGEAFADFSTYRDASGTPGYLRQADFDTRPRWSRTPHDRQGRDGHRFRPGVILDLADGLRLEAELGIERENANWRYADFLGVSQKNRRQREGWSFTPRLSWRHGLGRWKSETVAGLDHYDAEIAASGSAAPRQGAEQTSTAFYLQNQTELLPGLNLTLGGRTQRMEQLAWQSAYAPWFSPAMRGDSTRRRNAWEAGLAYAQQNWRVYGKVGTTFRFANTDELFAYDPFTFAPVFAGDLKPQRGTLQEIGGSVSLAAVTARLSLYRMKLKDEIGYDGLVFSNVNFDPTRRQGGEAEVDWQIAPAFKARLNYAYSDARFRDGPYKDQQIPLVGRHKGSLQLTWDGGAVGRYTLVASRVGKRHYSGDFRNERKMLAGYQTVDLQATWDLKPWVLSLALQNVFDKRYSPYAGYSPTIADYYYYPADGRSLRFTARYNFF